MTIVPISLGVFAGICLYIGFLHLLVACGRLNSLLNFCFGLICLVSAGYIFALIAQYLVTDIAIYIKARKILSSLGYLFAIIDFWFVALYTGFRPIRLILVLNSLYLICLVINYVSPAGILYSHISKISSIALPWGESITHPQGTLSPLFGFQILALTSQVIFVFYACFRQYRRGERQAALTLGISLLILAGTAQHDRLVDLGKLQFVYLTECGFLAFIVIMSLRLSKDLIQAVKLREQLVESERLRKLAVAMERNRLARDLHDSVSQTLSTVATIAEALPRVWKRNPEKAQQGLGELTQLTQGALAEMRNLLLELRPDGLSKQPLGTLLQQLTRAVSGRTSLEITTTIKGDQPLSNEVKLVFYRIAQEALNNIIRHAQATHVSVKLYGDASKTVLRIRDNGCGFDLNTIPHGHLGITIMKERAEAIGATFYLESSIQEGTEILLSWDDA